MWGAALLRVKSWRMRSVQLFRHRTPVANDITAITRHVRLISCWCGSALVVFDSMELNYIRAVGQKGGVIKQALLLFAVLSLCISCSSTRNDRPNPQHAFQTSFAEYLKGSGSSSLTPEEYEVAFVDLNKDDILDAVALVSLWKTGFAGSGGGTLFVFAGTQDDSYRFISKSTVTRAPIYVRKTTNEGWRDLVVRSSGGAIRSSDRIMLFDGKGYPRNPSVEAKTRIQKSDRMIIGSSESCQCSGTADARR